MENRIEKITITLDVVPREGETKSELIERVCKVMDNSTTTEALKTAGLDIPSWTAEDGGLPLVISVVGNDVYSVLGVEPAASPEESTYVHGACPGCGEVEELLVASYQVGNANTPITIWMRDGEVRDFEFSRTEGDVSEIDVYCSKCGELFCLDDAVPSKKQK